MNGSKQLILLSGNVQFMTEKVRNRILYWALAIVPLVGLWMLGKVCGPFWFVGLLLFYTFIYRPTLDTQRLMSLNAIEEKDAWRFFVPFAIDHTRYIKTLWLS